MRPTSMASDPVTQPDRSTATRTRAGHGRGWLLAGSALVLLGSVLPWITLPGIAAVSGLQTAGRWTFYLAFLGVAGALVPWRRAAVAQGAVAGAAAIGLPVLQVLRLLGAGAEGWQAGVGLFTCVAGGSVIGRAVLRLAADRS